ncbi:MAG: ATP-binding protein, partial [Dehalococcoidales bacterium]
MGINLQKYEPEIDVGYEIYQIIRDFDNPIQIFREAFQNSIDEEATEVCCRVSVQQRLGGEDLILDIWDNGLGMR